MIFNALAVEIEWFLFATDSPLSIARTIALWLTIALALAFLIAFFLLKGQRRKSFATISGRVAIVYACLLGILFLVLSFLDGGIVTILFVPLLVLLLVFAACGTMLSFYRTKTTYILAACLTTAALIAVLVCIGLHYSWGDALSMNAIEKEDVDTVALYVSAIGCVALIVALGFWFGRKDKNGFDTRSITFAAVCIAMSFALSYLRLLKMANGGAVTVASLLPLMLYSYMFGTKKGVFAGMIYGVLQALQDPYILHPAQFLLDYPIAFAAIGLAGMFARSTALKHPQTRFACGALVAGALRFLVHFLSGIFAFGSTASIQPVWLFSLIYQATYIPLDIIIVIVVGVLVLSSKSFLSEIERYSSSARKSDKKESVPTDPSQTDPSQSAQ